jgi:prevent-host-death family protein
MSSVGIRELRQRASELLRRVEAGEAIEVTDRGRPVALLTPVPQQGRIERLRAAGEVVEASAKLSDLPLPLRPAENHDLPSVVLRKLRRDER